jgi:hypothetical protein
MVVATIKYVLRPPNLPVSSLMKTVSIPPRDLPNASPCSSPTPIKPLFAIFDHPRHPLLSSCCNFIYSPCRENRMRVCSSANDFAFLLTLGVSLSVTVLLARHVCSLAIPRTNFHRNMSLPSSIIMLLPLCQYLSPLS